jgi:hypothetical protein
MREAAATSCATALNPPFEGRWAPRSASDKFLRCDEHEFMHSRIFSAEREAILAGLSEGMDWVRLEMSNTLSVHAGQCPGRPE